MSMKGIFKQAIAFLTLGILLTNAFPQNISVEADSDAATDSTRTNVSTYGSGLVIEPTMVFEPNTFSEISALSSSQKKPASIILTPDASMNVELDGETKTLESVYDSYLKRKFIPIVRIDTNTVSAFIRWQNKTYAVDDMMVMSSDITVISQVYSDERCSLLNTVYDLTDQTISSNRYDCADYVGTANAVGCNILMFDAADENFSVAADYISTFTKCCWGYVKNKTEAVSAIADGAYGVVANDASILSSALAYFSKSGFATAQKLAAHRGITAYANENSLTAIASSVSEGATHVEIDLQITADREIVVCHDSSTNATSISGTYFERATLASLRKLTLSDYSEKYAETYPTLEEVISLAKNNDLTFILELKFSGGSTNVVDNLKPIDKLKEIMDAHPEMKGRWYAITFYAPFAERMKEIMPEIPVGYLGGATSGKETDLGQTGWNGGHVSMTSISNKIAFLRKYNIGLDETYYETATSTTAQNYLARGYTQNTWTFENIAHFGVKANVATTNAAEKCAMFAKEIGVGELNISAADIQSGKVTVPCRTYNGWLTDLTCDVIVVDQTDSGASILLYYQQPWTYTQTLTNKDPETITGYYGLYSQLLQITY